MTPRPGYTRPLDLRQYITCAPKPGFDPVPWIDLCVLALVLGLSSSRLVFVPGTLVDLPRYDASGQGAFASPAVLTVDLHDVAYFEGLKIPVAGLERALLSYKEQRPAQQVLLIKADARIPLQQLLRIMELARTAGYAQVQLATELPEASPRAGG